MTHSKVAIVGSGVAGATIAFELTRRGHDVTVFEVGPECDYPHREQFTNEVLNLEPTESLYVPRDLRSLDVSGNYKNAERMAFEQIMVVGGMATRWSGWTPRYRENDFKTRSVHGYGMDWPITYTELEPYFCRAEAHLGISGTDDDNPHAPWRSKPYPLPPFSMAYDDRLLRDRLAQHDIRLSSVPQARVSRPYDGRLACANFGVCSRCPIGARYSPNHHLALAQRTGRLTLLANTAVRGLHLDDKGAIASLTYYPGNQRGAEEHSAKIFIVAAGAIETARLLLLSKSRRFPDGLGNASGHLGQHLLLNHNYMGSLTYKDTLYPGRTGPRSAQVYAIRETKGAHGEFFKVDFATGATSPGGELPAGRGAGDPVGDRLKRDLSYRSGKDVMADMQSMLHVRTFGVHTETTSSPDKYVALSPRTDRFGSPFASVRHVSNEFDLENRRVVRAIAEELAQGSGATLDFNTSRFDTGHHHLGTTRMASDASDGVTDSLGRVHGVSNLYVAGASLFPSASAANPTLTLTALALRTCDSLLGRLGPV